MVSPLKEFRWNTAVEMTIPRSLSPSPQCFSKKLIHSGLKSHHYDTAAFKIQNLLIIVRVLSHLRISQ